MPLQIEFYSHLNKEKNIALDVSRKIAICIENIKHKCHANIFLFVYEKKCTMYFYIQCTVTNHYPPQLRHDAFGLGKFGHHRRPNVGFAGQNATGDTWGVALGGLTMIGGASVELGYPKVIVSRWDWAVAILERRIQDQTAGWAWFWD